MKMHMILKTAAVAVLLSSAVTAPHVPGFSGAAWAKGNGGNGNGNGGGNGGGQGADRSGRDASHQSKTKSERGPAAFHGKPHAERRHTQTGKPKSISKASLSPSEIKGLNSLNRNYRAYLNSQDPRMAAVAAYAKAYAQYEIDTGLDPAVDDAALGDEALRDALRDFTGKPVSDRTLERAKDVLGVGSAQGKIDQIRADLEE